MSLSQVEDVNAALAAPSTFTKDEPAASAALSQAIVSSRHGRNAAQRGQRSGRLDKRSLAKVGVGDTHVFIRKTAPAPDRIRVTILLDASGSMSQPAAPKGIPWSERWQYPTLAKVAAQTGRNLAGATDRLPWVTADVVAFTTGREGTALFPLWKTGDPRSDMDAYDLIPKSGTEEGFAIAFAMDEMLEKRGPREQCLIIIVSDGAPSEPNHVKSVVETCRQNRIPVVSVALVESAHQPTMYGHDNVVDYTANPRALARAMAKVIGRVL